MLQVDNRASVVEKETAVELQRHVAKLPPEQQEYIRLRFGQGLSNAETAAVMAVGALRHRAIGGLSDSLAHHGRPVLLQRDTYPLRRARHAVVEVRQRMAEDDMESTEQERAQLLARWHADGQVTARKAETVTLARGTAGGAA
jgi:hypothetical protein